MNITRLLLSLVISALALPADASEPVSIGSRLELFIDDYLIDRMDGARLELHNPQRRDVAVVVDKPWEGRGLAYVSVFQDGDVYRMYYRGVPIVDRPPNFTCYAESRDGKTWKKPELGLWAYDGSKQNNIVWPIRPGGHNLAVFKDANPDPALGQPPNEDAVLHGPRPERWKGSYPPQYRPDPAIVGMYKALGGVIPFGIHVLKSDDALRWTYAHPAYQPIINGYDLDSQNICFWDAERDEYRIYFRHRRNRKRDIMTATSRNLLDWTGSEPVFLEYEGAPQQDLYTSVIAPYHRAPHIFVAFPKRMTQRRRLTDDPRDGVTDSVFMSSRDGQRFRLWGEAVIRPGLEQDHWRSRTNAVSWGPVETAADSPGLPPELSLYVHEYADGGRAQLRRYVYRMDGFVSLQAPLSGGEVVTKPLIFDGSRLVLNVATSAAGSVRVELLDGDGRPLPDYRLRDCEEIYGNSIKRIVRWKTGDDLSSLADQPIRLRFVLRDADLYAFRFQP
jgi:hypothetical protein